MTVNRYDQAIPYEYVSQYVANPIPFQELLTLGMYYGEQRKEAEKQLSQYIKDANEFQSLIEKDVDNYYNIAFNDLIQSKINEAAADPSVMKSSAWRAGLTGALNSVNYAELSKLKKSAEQADQYDKLYKALAAEGLMPPGWEQDYYSTYDTLTDGIFDKTPLPYGSVEDVAWDFVKDMKDTYLGSHGGYNWFGVDEDMVFDQVDARKSELLANPKVQRHLQILQNAGMSKELALQEIMNRAQTAALRRVSLKPETNPYAYLASQYKYKTEAAAASNQISQNYDRISQIQAGAQSRTNDYIDYLSQGTFGVPFSELSDDQKNEIRTVSQMSAKDPNVRKQLSVQLDWGEYLNYQDPSGSIRTNLTDNEGNVIKGEDNLEEYLFRNTDVVFTQDGLELAEVPISFLKGRQVKDGDRTINIGNILQLITDSAFKGDGTANMYNNNGTNPYNANENYMIANGKLIVPEEIIEQAIEAAYPEEAGAIMTMFKKGIKDPATGRRSHKILNEYRNNDAHLYGYDDLYEINIGRAFGNDAATNARFNEDRMKEVMGTATVAKNQQSVIGSSWSEAGNATFE